MAARPSKQFRGSKAGATDPQIPSPVQLRNETSQSRSQTHDRCARRAISSGSMVEQTRSRLAAESMKQAQIVRSKRIDKTDRIVIEALHKGHGVSKMGAH